MLKKLLLSGAAAVFALAVSFSVAPSKAAPLHSGARTIAIKNGLVDPVRHRRRHHRKANRAQRRRSGVGVFIMPGLYWGPAWWDSAYSKACWRNIRPCPRCAKNWTFVCA